MISMARYEHDAIVGQISLVITNHFLTRFKVHSVRLTHTKCCKSIQEPIGLKESRSEPTNIAK